MNATALALPRENEVQSKVRKIRRFGRGARVALKLLFALGLVMCAPLLYYSVFGAIGEPKSGNGGANAVLTSPLTMNLRMWASFGFWFAAGYQLYRMFCNLAAGAIYTPENVRRVRNVGLLWLVFTVLGMVLPATLDIARQLIDGSIPIPKSFALAFSWLSQSLVSLFSAALILLASWIMDVGLHEKDHAEALQRDAELVI